MFIAIYAVLFTLSIGAVLGVSLEQRDLSTTKEKTKTVQISCKVKGLTTDYVHWYHKKDNEEALKRILYVKKGSSPVPDNNHPDAGDFKVRIQDDNYDLNIHKLKESHSGVYYCASWVRDSSGYDYKVFGSGTRLTVIENVKDFKSPQVSAYPVSKPQNGKSVLLCQARGMFPDLVRFTWKAKDQRGSILELKDAEQLEQRDENPVQITSMLIIDQHKAMNNKFTCSVQHDSNSNDVDIPKEVTQKSNANITCPSPKAEEEDEEEPMNTGLFELSRSLHLFSVTYVILLVKNVLYFCTVSVLLYKRNSANMEMFKSKAR